MLSNSVVDLNSYTRVTHVALQFAHCKLQNAPFTKSKTIFTSPIKDYKNNENPSINCLDHLRSLSEIGFKPNKIQVQTTKTWRDKIKYCGATMQCLTIPIGGAYQCVVVLLTQVGRGKVITQTKSQHRITTSPRSHGAGKSV